MSRLLMYGAVLLMAAALVVSQTIRPDGIAKTTTDNLVDLSSCDQVVIEVPLSRADVSQGVLRIYEFKKHGIQTKITCQMFGGSTK